MSGTDIPVAEKFKRISRNEFKDFKNGVTTPSKRELVDAQLTLMMESLEERFDAFKKEITQGTYKKETFKFSYVRPRQGNITHFLWGIIFEKARAAIEDVVIMTDFVFTMDYIECTVRLVDPVEDAPVIASREKS